MNMSMNTAATTTTTTASSSSSIWPKRRRTTITTTPTSTSTTTSKLFRLFVVLNGCGFLLFLVVLISTRDPSLPSTISTPTTRTTTSDGAARNQFHWREDGRRGTLEITTGSNSNNNETMDGSTTAMMTTTSLNPISSDENNQQQEVRFLDFIETNSLENSNESVVLPDDAAYDVFIEEKTTDAVTTTTDADASKQQPEQQQPLGEQLQLQLQHQQQILQQQRQPDPMFNDPPPPDPDGSRLETIRRLEALGVNISEFVELLPYLPPWSSVTAQYGDGPRIHGLDTCQQYRNTIPVDERTMAPTGLFNSGTNLLAFMMEDNCQISNGKQKYGGCRLPQRGISWQPPWGKHNPITARYSDYTINRTIYLNVPHHVVLPVVTVRHPLDWMDSTCRHRYALRFVRWDRYDGKTCPFIVAKPPDSRPVPVFIDYAYPGRRYYKSLAHLWNRWNRPYFEGMHRHNASISSIVRGPRLMVRHEDLIFFPDQVVKRICHCIGGHYLFHGKGFQLTVESAKIGPGHGQRKTGFVDAWIKYGHARSYQRMDPLDKAKAIEFLDPQMIQRFHYQLQ